MNNSDADTPCIISATLIGDVSELTPQTWRDWASASDVTRLRLADLNWVNFEDGKMLLKNIIIMMLLIVSSPGEVWVNRKV